MADRIQKEIVEDNSDFSLDSILAEYKSSAYIDGQRKTSPDLLDERISHIMSDSKEGTLASNELYTLRVEQSEDFFTDIRDLDSSTAAPIQSDIVMEKLEENPVEVPEVDPVAELSEEDSKLAYKTAQIDWEPVKASNSFEQAKQDAAAFFERRDSAVEERKRELVRLRKKEEKDRNREEHSDEQSEITVDGQADNSERSNNSDEELFLDDYRFASSEEGQQFEADWESIFHGNASDNEEDNAGSGKHARRLLRKRKRKNDIEESLETGNEESADEPEPEYLNFFVDEETYVDEPELVEELNKLVKLRRRLMLQGRFGILLSLVMGVITLLFEKGVSLPGVDDNLWIFTSVVAVMHVLVAALSADILVRGVRGFFHREVGAESIITVSAIACAVHYGLILSGKLSEGISFSAISAFAMSLAVWGEYRRVAAMCLSLKTALATENPATLNLCFQPELECNVIKKYNSSAMGFYNNLVAEDYCEELFHEFGWVLLLIALLLSGVFSFLLKISFIPCLSALLTAIVPFTAAASFAVPFSGLAKRLRSMGAAVAGWGAADAVYYADGIRLTDHDLFPDGAYVSEVKFFDPHQSDRAIAYTAGGIISSGCLLSAAFQEYLHSQGMTPSQIDNLQVCDSGLMFSVGTTRVLCGSAACMSLYGISVPKGQGSKAVVYTAFNDSLVAAFTMVYKPKQNVQNALLLFLKENLKPFIANRDFNITPSMLKQKFQISTEELEFFSSRIADKLAEDVPNEIPDTKAVIVKNTPGTYAETVAGARRLYSVTRINSIISLVVCFISLFVVFLSYISGTVPGPSGLLEFLLIMEVIVLLIGRVV